MSDRQLQELRRENERLRDELAETREVLAAIRNGEVDALLVAGPQGDRVYTLKGAEHAYRLLVETMTEGAVTLGRDGTILYCNHRFSRMLDLEHGRVMGSSIFDLLKDPDRFAAHFAQAAENEARVEVSLKRPDNSELPVLASMRRLLAEDLDTVCMVVTDLSEQKRTERKQKLHTETLERKNRELQDFAFAASHDLREPLRKITVFGERLTSRHRDQLDEQSADYLMRMQRAARRMQGLLDGLLAYSRVATREQPLRPVALGDILLEVVSNLEIQIQEAGAEVEIEKLPVIEADATQMEQLFQNLIANAVKFRRPDFPPRIRIAARRAEPASNSNSPVTGSGPQWQILVEDNGIGFEEKYLDLIFAPFKRLHGQEHYPGTGMGLAICRKIVERHRGTITARSQPDHGSTFIVTLPEKQLEPE